MPSFATTEATQQFSGKFPHVKYNRLGATNLTVSAAGFGSYRVHVSVDTHRQALLYALDNGINLIDTSSNYADGGAEELIGVVLNDLEQAGKIKREEIVIVGKAGYLQGQNFQQSQQLKEQGNPYPDLVEYSPNLEHCIHPRFLEDQLTQSLNRLKLDCIDVYLLHNPEYYLLWAHNNGLPRETAEQEFYRRIEQAFMHLEIEAQNGRIRYYGISSNTFPAQAKMYGFVELNRIYDIASTLSRDSKFQVIQFPFNLLEKGALVERNQNGKQNILDFAAEKELAVLVNRPLNAFQNNQLRRLVDIEVTAKHNPQSLAEKLAGVTKLENFFTEKILATLQLDENGQKELSGLFSSGSYLNSNYRKLGPYWSWMDSQARFITDQISYAVQQVNENLLKNSQTVQWLDDYVQLFNDLLGELTLYYGDISSRHNKQILKDIKNENPSFSKYDSLQQAALATLFSNESISCTLVGMRQKEYVEDVLDILRKEK